jgi:hypothetical protein
MPTIYSARWEGPSILEKNAANVITLDVEHSGSAASLTSGVLYLYDQGGTAIVDGVAGTVGSGTFTSATIAASVTQDKTLGKGYSIRVDLVIGTETIKCYNDAVLAVARPQNPVGQTDLVNRHSEAANLLAGSSNLQGYLDAAYRDVLNSLYLSGVPYWTWRTPSALRPVIIARSFSILFLDYATLLQGDDRYYALSRHYNEIYEREMNGLKSMIDVDETNTLEPAATTGSAVILLSGASRRRRTVRSDS